MLNLLSNSLKHTPPTGQITVSAEQKGPQLELVVSDTGRGIPETVLPHIFDKFRSGPQTSLVQSSSGLGLTFCLLAITAHGGEIKVCSELGKGTQVYLLLAGSQPESERLLSSPLLWAQADRERLQTVLQALKRLDVYEISEIRQALKPLEEIRAR